MAAVSEQREQGAEDRAAAVQRAAAAARASAQRLEDELRVANGRAAQLEAARTEALSEKAELCAKLKLGAEEMAHQREKYIVLEKAAAERAKQMAALQTRLNDVHELVQTLASLQSQQLRAGDVEQRNLLERLQELGYVKSESATQSRTDSQSRGGGSAASTPPQSPARPPPARPPLMTGWVDDTDVASCPACGKQFGLMLRRHHCRHCGGIFCANCSAQSVALPRLGFTDPVRVCDPCHELLAGDTAAR